MRYIDIHSHLNLPEFKDDLDDVAARLRAQAIATIVVGVDKETSASALAIAGKYDNIFACIGQHPTDNSDEAFDAEFYQALAASPKVVAIGECGLDYFRLKENIESEKERQKKIFLAHIDLAIATNRPLMIHARPNKGTMDAYEDVLDILEASVRGGKAARGDVHFFVGDIAIADRFLALGFTMSFTGVITFASDYDAVVRHLPLASILSETDAPFATPVPFRGKRCEPEHVMVIAARIAEIRGEDVEIVREALIANAERLFGLSSISKASNL
jgi:TatD DNase family protein